MYYTIAQDDGPHEWLRAEADGLRAYSPNGACQSPRPYPDLDAALAGSKVRGRCAPTDFSPGEFHPRIQRQADPRWVAPTPPLDDIYIGACRTALTSLRIVLSRLDETLRVVEPAPANMSAFGHEIRMVLVLGAMEVESGLKAVLVANEIPAGGQRYSMRDFRKLFEPMRLAEWSVRLTGNEDYPAIQPFASWPSKWWSDYNAVKHDAENNLPQATLGSALNAVAAAYIVVAAQFGARVIHGLDGIPVSLGMRADDFPKWLPNEYYIPPQIPGGHETWTARKLTL
jgi:hypothetical protein